MFRVTHALAALLVSAFGFIGGATTPPTPLEFAPERRAPAVVLHEADARWADTVAWAYDRFTEAGLTPPNADVHVHVDTHASECRGFAGYFSVSAQGPRVDLCVAYLDSDLGTELRDKLVLHELAHAWDYENLDEPTRSAFMEKRGVATWNHPDEDHHSRGIEHAANSIAYSLMPEGPAVTGQTCGFVTLTGQTLPHGRVERCG